MTQKYDKKRLVGRVIDYVDWVWEKSEEIGTIHFIDGSKLVFDRITNPETNTQRLVAEFVEADDGLGIATGMMLRDDAISVARGIGLRFGPHRGLVNAAYRVCMTGEGFERGERGRPAEGSISSFAFAVQSRTCYDGYYLDDDQLPLLTEACRAALR